MTSCAACPKITSPVSHVALPEDVIMSLDNVGELRKYLDATLGGASDEDEA